jgi:hypothetical protein
VYGKEYGNISNHGYMIQIRLMFGARSIGVDLCGRADVYEASRSLKCFREPGNLQDSAERRFGGKCLEE